MYNYLNDLNALRHITDTCDITYFYVVKHAHIAWFKKRAFVKLEPLLS